MSQSGIPIANEENYKTPFIRKSYIPTTAFKNTTVRRRALGDITNTTFYPPFDTPQPIFHKYTPISTIRGNNLLKSFNESEIFDTPLVNSCLFIFTLVFQFGFQYKKTIS